MGRATNHSAKTGRFVSNAQVQRSPATTVRVVSGGKGTGAARSAKTGKFVTDAYAKAHPSTTINPSK